MGVKEAYLSDSALQQPEIITIAEENIIEEVTDYADKTDKDRIYLEAATVYECAVLVCPSMPARLPVASSGPHANFELKTDWAKKKEELQAMRDYYLSMLTTFEDITYFTITDK